jgi:hypothetical protein
MPPPPNDSRLGSVAFPLLSRKPSQKFLQGRSLYSEFGELLKETFSYKSELDKKFRIREALIREKNNEHANENLPFYWLRSGDYDKLKSELKRDATLVNLVSQLFAIYLVPSLPCCCHFYV